MLKLLIAILVVCCAFSVMAEEEAEPAEDQGQAIYLPLKPAFVVNYGGAGRLRYIKTEMSARLSTPEAANALRHHMPFVRNNLVMLFSAQTNETISSQDGKETLRKAALDEIRNILVRQEGLEPETVVDVYFNTFLVQK